MRTGRVLVALHEARIDRAWVPRRPRCCRTASGSPPRRSCSCSSARRMPTQRWMPKPNDRWVRGPGAVDDEARRAARSPRSSRLPETYHITTRSPFLDGLAAELGVLQRGAAHMRQRRLPADHLGHHGVDQRRIARSLSILRPGFRSAPAPSRSWCCGWCRCRRR